MAPAPALVIGADDAEAARLISAAPVVAWFSQEGPPRPCRTIAASLIRPDAVQIPMDYPVTTEIAVDDAGYNALLRRFMLSARIPCCSTCRPAGMWWSWLRATRFLRLVHAPFTRG